MKYKAVIFDLDGTIIDTNAIWRQLTTEMLMSKGIEITKSLEEDLQERLGGLAVHESCKIIKAIGGFEESTEELIEKKLNRANDLYNERGVTMIDGFSQFHAQLRKYNL